MKAKHDPISAKELRRDDTAEVDGAQLEWPRQSGNLERLKAALAVREKRQRRRRAKAAVAAAVLLLAAGFTWRFSTRPIAPATTTGRAIVTAPEHRVLPDGTVVELKDRSEITVDYAGPLRRVALRRGEAHFQVTKDPSRAFVVEAGGVEFRAVGTAFAVGLRTSVVEMVVTEGRVAVESVSVTRDQTAGRSSLMPPPATVVIVAAGNGVVVDLAVVPASPPAVVPLSAAESSEKLAWRVSRLEFNETRLAEAVAAINGHSHWRLTLADPALAGVEISGTLRADNVEPLLMMLETNFHIYSERRPDGEIALHRGKGPGVTR